MKNIFSEIKILSNSAITIKKNQILPVIDVIFSSVLLVHWSVIVVIHHPVHTQYIRLVVLNCTFRLQYNS